MNKYQLVYIYDKIITFIMITLPIFLIGCTPLQPRIVDIETVTDESHILTLPYRTHEYGLIFLEDIVVEGIPLTFIIDTGATKSVIFDSALQKIKIPIVHKEQAFVHGMTNSGSHQIIEVENFQIGKQNYENMTLIVLSDREAFEQPGYAQAQYDGLIGMDILSNYVMYISRKTSEIKFIPTHLTLEIPGSWDRVELIENPSLKRQHNLHFIETRLNGRLVPTLLDTGAEFSLMNWHTASYPELKRQRKRMRERWEIQGAVGSFSPRVKIRVANFRAGQKHWNNKDFIIMDFDSLDILGMRDEPYAIAGANLFEEESLVIDFERNFIAYKPKVRESQSESILRIHISR